MSDLLEKINQGILDGSLEDCQEAVQQAMDAGLSADDILKKGLVPAMAEVGRLFEEGEYFVPEMLIAARAMQGGLNLLKPLLISEKVEPIGKVVIGTVKGDLHDIGKNLVAIMMEGAGFEIVDLGTDVPVEKFVSEVKEKKADILAMSALLTTTMTTMPTVITALKDAGIRDGVKVMVGGAPVTQEFAAQIGADGYSPDASQAARLALTYFS
ncbi:MAG: cobalamin-binding protein [Chloroflexi bacterium]|jgi:5-methyltetrahydrofolate--homocysteine methyltransferase|nr:cobalamin-binding protein [Chloroflexota bacterium]